MLVKIRVIVLPPHTSEMKNQQQNFQQDIEKISLKYQDSQLNPEEVDQVLKQLRTNLLHQPIQESIQVVYDPCTDNFIQRASQVFQKGFEIQVFGDSKQYNVVAKDGKITVSEPDIPVKIPKEEGVRVEIKDAKTLLEIQKHKHPSKIVDILIDFTKLGAGDIEELGLPQMVSLCKLELKQLMEKQEASFSWSSAQKQQINIFNLNGIQKFQDLEELIIYRSSDQNCQYFLQLQQLKTLKISACDKLLSVQEIMNIDLQKVEIVDCGKIQQITFEEDNQITKSLQELVLTKCGVQKIDGLQFLAIKTLQITSCTQLQILEFGDENSCISKSLDTLEIKSSDTGQTGFVLANNFNPVAKVGLKQIVGLKHLPLKKLALQMQQALQEIDFGSNEEPSTLQKSLLELSMPNCGFEAMKGLHHLSLEKMKFAELRQLKELDFGPENSILSQKLKELEINGCENERILNLNNLQIDKLTLQSLNKLTSVDFGESEKPMQKSLRSLTLQSCTLLNTIKGFETLHINECVIRYCLQVKQIQRSCNSLDSLKQLKLEGVGITNIKGIQDTQLEKLQIISCIYLEEIEFTNNCKLSQTLSELQISCQNAIFGQQNNVSKIKSITGLDQLKLKILTIQDCLTIDILVLGNTDADNLAPLQRSIEKIYLVSCSFSEIIGLALMSPIETKLINLQNLKNINMASQNNGHCETTLIQGCGIEKINGFTCNNSGTLGISGCDKLTKLFDEQEQKLTLTALSIQSTKIEDYSFLNLCTMLQKLDLDGFKVKSIENLPIIESLQQIQMRNSDVKNCVGCEKFPNLTTLNIIVVDAPAPFANQQFAFNFGQAPQPNQPMPNQPANQPANNMFNQQQQAQALIQFESLKGISQSVTNLSIKCNIYMLKGSRFCSNVKKLNLHNAPIKNWTFLNNFKGLETLDVSVAVTALKNLRVLKNLKFLCVQDNFGFGSGFSAFQFGSSTQMQDTQSQLADYIPEWVQPILTLDRGDVTVDEKLQERIAKSREYVQQNPEKSIHFEYNSLVSKKQNLLAERQHTKEYIQELKMQRVLKDVELKTYAEKIKNIFIMVKKHM